MDILISIIVTLFLLSMAAGVFLTVYSLVLAIITGGK